MSDRDLLWVEVSATAVTFCPGPKMPEPDTDFPVFVFGGTHQSRKEFARWSGLTFPKGAGIYAVRVKLATMKRYRVVRSEEFVAAKYRTAKLEEVK
jgi:hypothetical protein